MRTLIITASGFVAIFALTPTSSASPIPDHLVVKNSTQVRDARNGGIAGTPVVTIANASTTRDFTEPPARPTSAAQSDERSRQAFQQRVRIDTDPNTGLGEAVIQVPASCRLVIQHIGAYAEEEAPQIGVFSMGASPSYEHSSEHPSGVEHYRMFLDRTILAYATVGAPVGGPGIGAAGDGCCITLTGYLEK